MPKLVSLRDTSSFATIACPVESMSVPTVSIAPCVPSVTVAAAESVNRNTSTSPSVSMRRSRLTVRLSSGVSAGTPAKSMKRFGWSSAAGAPAALTYGAISALNISKRP